jgi:hypothetical protein
VSEVSQDAVERGGVRATEAKQNATIPIYRKEGRQDMKKSAIVLTLALLGALIVFGQDKKPEPAQPAAPAVMPLTPAGQLAFKAVVMEYQALQKDANTLLNSELDAQHLKRGEWNLDVNNGVLVRMNVPQTPNGTAPADEKNKAPAPTKPEKPEK